MSDIDIGDKLTFKDLFFSPPYMLAALAASVSQFIYSYMEPILAKRLEDLDLTQVQIGWFFMILPASYIPGSIGLDYLPKTWDKRGIIMFGACGCGLSLFLVGPSSLFNPAEENILSMMIVGQALLGLFIPFGLILALPTMVESAIKKYPG